MSPFFLFNNLHFSLEILGAVAFMVVAWLAFDAFLIRRDFVTASRGIGFASLAIWQIIHGFGFTTEFYIYLGYIFYFLGLILVAVNLWIESKVERPKFRAVLILPGFALFAPWLNSVATVGLLFVAFLAYRQYKLETKKSLYPFVLGFAFLTLGAIISIFYKPDSLGFLWMLGHVFELVGFFAIVKWVWNYLELRVREEMLLIFVSVIFFMAVVVSLVFSSILINQMETTTKSNLLSNTRVMDLAILRLQEEAKAKVNLLADRSDLTQAVIDNNFAGLEKISTQLLENEKLGFLTVLNKNGEVILRAHALTKKEDNLSGEKAVSKALEGESFVSIESSPAEKFSIRAASPLVSKNQIVGVLVGGFQLDNAFVDLIKKITGLDISIFDGKVRVATTIFNPDRKTRSIGIEEVNEKVLESVLSKKEPVILSALILSRPYLASYIPLIDSDNKVVGMISAAKAQHEILNTLVKINRLTLITVMIIMLILVIPIYLVTKRLIQELG